MNVCGEMRECLWGDMSEIPGLDETSFCDCKIWELIAFHIFIYRADLNVENLRVIFNLE